MAMQQPIDPNQVQITMLNGGGGMFQDEQINLAVDQVWVEMLPNDDYKVEKMDKDQTKQAVS